MGTWSVSYLYTPITGNNLLGTFVTNLAMCGLVQEAHRLYKQENDSMGQARRRRGSAVAPIGMKSDQIGPGLAVF